jgi:hypothetical protein
MKSSLFLSEILLAGVVFASFAPAPGACADAPKGGPTPATAAAAPAEIPLSVFILPSNPKEGRNPFFPQSVAAAPVIKSKEATVDTSAIVLNGITSPPKRTAMINGRTFEPGEEGEIRMSGGGKTLIKCVQITDDSAVILVNGVRRELRLRMGV